MQRRKFNTKRKIDRAPRSAGERKALADMAKRVSYGGNPEHKRDPSDFNLTPPSSPRQGKTLCDELGVVTKEKALQTLKKGVEKGLVSAQKRNGWPQNIWALYDGRSPVEAMLENPASGTYHGYPLQLNDPFREVVLERWRQDE